MLRIPTLSTVLRLTFGFALALLAQQAGAQETPATAAVLTSHPDTRVAVGVGALGLRSGDDLESMSLLEVEFPFAWKGLRPWAGGLVAENGCWFAGAGLLYRHALPADFFITAGTGPFYYQRNSDRDLGFDLEFYSYLELSHTLRDELRLGLRGAHLSNASLGKQNPGVEFVALVISRPFRSH